MIKIFRRLLPLLLLTVLSLPACYSLFKPFFFQTMDGGQHVARFAGFVRAMGDGQIIPRWIDGVSWGLGSPALNYGGFLPNLFAGLPRILGFSLSSSVEIVLGLSLILSAVSFYVWAKRHFPNNAAFIGSLFYVWAPYRLLDIYVRGAYPEAVAFMFLPLALLGLDEIYDGNWRKGVLIGSISMGAVILCHNIVGAMTVLVFVGYLLIKLLVSKQNRNILPALMSIIFAFLISAFSWMPGFLERGEVNLDSLSRSNSHLTNFVGVNDLIYSKWGWSSLDSSSPMSLQVGVFQVAIIILSLFLIFKRRVDSKPLAIFSLLGIATVIFLVNPMSVGLWNNINLLAFVLYPWRFMFIGVFLSAVLAGFVFSIFKSKLIVGLAIVLLIVLNINYVRTNGPVNEKDYYYENYQDTTDMWGEYLPVGADLNTVKKCKITGCKFEKLIFPKGVSVDTLIEKSNLYEFNYSSKNDFKATINSYYFPGWKIFLDGKLLENSINSLGTIDLSLPKGSHHVEAKFTNTQIRKIAEKTSLVSFTFLLSFVLWKSSKKNYFSS